MIVPLQSLSKCHQQFCEDTVPWTGHRRSRKCQKRACKKPTSYEEVDETDRDSQNNTKGTRQGSRVTLSQRYRVNCINWPSDPAYLGGASCKDHVREGQDRGDSPEQV